MCSFCGMRPFLQYPTTIGFKVHNDGWGQQSQALYEAVGLQLCLLLSHRTEPCSCLHRDMTQSRKIFYVHAMSFFRFNGGWVNLCSCGHAP